MRENGFIDMPAVAVAWSGPDGKRQMACAMAGAEGTLIEEIIRRGVEAGDPPVVELRSTTVRVKRPEGTLHVIYRRV